MRGYIKKIYDSSYTIVVNLGRDPATGKRKQFWTSVKGTKKDAEHRLAEILHQMDTGTFMKPGKTTVAEFLERWLNDYKSNLSPRSLDRYTSIVQTHLVPGLGSIALTKLRPEHLAKHYATAQDAGLSARSVRYHHAVLHVALKTAVKWGLLPRNPADAVDAPKIRRTEMKTWDEGEIGQFLETARDTPYYSLFYLALFTGMRRGELLAIRWQDVDLLLGQVSVNRSLHQLRDGSFIFTEPKSEKSRRTIALPPSAVLMLRAHWDNMKAQRAAIGSELPESALVFEHLDGTPLRPNTVTRAWEMTAARAGVRVIRLHDARHSHASLMLKQGVHPKIVQERLGHSSIAMTLDTYSHVAPGLQAAAAEKFDQVLKLGRPARSENRPVENIG